MRHARHLSTRGAIGALAALALAAGAAVAVQTPAAAHESSGHLAATPPMGWNSWNAFHKNIDEQLIKDIADRMVSSGMRDAGYQYVVVDGGWRADTRAAASATRTVSADVTGADEVALVVDDNGSGSSDHADWADARVSCGTA